MACDSGVASGVKVREFEKYFETSVLGILKFFEITQKTLGILIW